ncbi:hypothetical protein BC832DRAFT_237671 [Gaertneriomyces semiglobifer]|nr:hypothetical protein BC832DRAFT_237671 [Gaertneriomyces semiglobifer]
MQVRREGRSKTKILGCGLLLRCVVCVGVKFDCRSNQPTKRGSLPLRCNDVRSIRRVLLTVTTAPHRIAAFVIEQSQVKGPELRRCDLRLLLTVLIILIRKRQRPGGGLLFPDSKFSNHHSHRERNGNSKRGSVPGNRENLKFPRRSVVLHLLRPHSVFVFKGTGSHAPALRFPSIDGFHLDNNFSTRTRRT